MIEDVHGGPGVGPVHSPVYFARGGRRVAAVIDADDLQEILQLAEDMCAVLDTDGRSTDPTERSPHGHRKYPDVVP